MNDVLAADLGTAIAREEIFAVFQPQVDLADGSIVAAEVLCRWRHPTHGLVPPDEFIPVAEELGAISAIGRFMLDQGLRAVEAWRNRGRSIEVSVNVSPVQLATDDFISHVGDEMARRGLPPGALNVELTETRPLGNLSDVVESLEHLRALGLGVALDDFGAGHASTAHLELLPITEVKIDRSLIQSDSDATRDELAGSLRLARGRHLRVVAEGIESPSHLRRAKALLCDRAQGFLLGRPMTRESFDALLAL